ncbi:MAG: hypothetical protein DI548_02545 [Flavobacterium johnsoniae]|nr:MAG: hypothetical protein DI548_02545 [Flavobacterium johnsoniae]
MAKENTQDFLFTLFKLTTEQFAVFEENYEVEGELEMSLQSKFKVDPKNRILGVFLLFKLRMEESLKEVLIIECGLHFQLEKKSWDSCLSNNNKTLTIPYVYASHFSTIAIGAARGMLHAKTEGTSVNHLMLPLMTVDKFIDSNDLVLDLSNINTKKKKPNLK